MTVVVSDTSPLNYLLMIGEIAILHRLYDKVLVPAEVLAEMQDDGAPSEVLQVGSVAARLARGSQSGYPSR